MKTKLMLVLIIIVTFFTACSKDDEPSYYPVNPVSNSYTFLDDTIAITDAEYSSEFGDTYLKFSGENTDNHIYFKFTGRTGVVPVGSFTYRRDQESGYLVDSNFSIGAVSHPSDQLDFYATEGSLIVTKEANGIYKVSFNLLTNVSTAKGTYSGVILLSN